MSEKKKSKRQEGLDQAVRGEKQRFESAGNLAKGVEDSVDAVNSLVHLKPFTAMKKAGSSIRNVVKAVGTSFASVFNGIVGLGKMLFNHPEWYSNYPLDSMVNVNYGHRLNMDRSAITDLIKVDGTLADSSRDGSRTTTMASIIAQLTIPADKDKSFFQAMDILYARIRAANGGAVNYTADDLAAYILNVRSLRAALAYARRLLACANTADAYNVDVPGGLVALATNCRIHQNTVVSHAAELQNSLRIWFRTVQALMPINLPLLDRCDWMFSNIFSDSNDQKGNYYAFVLRNVPNFKVINGVINNDNGNLDFELGGSTVSEQTSESNYQLLITAINGTIARIQDEYKNSIIAGDILKAFGASSFYKQEEYPVGMDQFIIYDEAALTQIQNATVLGIEDWSSTFPTTTPKATLYASRDNAVGIATEFWQLTASVYKQTSGGYPAMHLYAQDSDVANGVSAYQNVIINSYKDIINPAETISFTRLAAGAYVAGNDTDGYHMRVHVSGSEVVTDLCFITKSNQGYANLSVARNSNFNNTNARSVSTLQNYWSIMDWAPLLILKQMDATGTGKNLTVLFDFNNYAVINVEKELQQLHEFATLSLLFVQPVAYDPTFKFTMPTQNISKGKSSRKEK